MYNIVQAMLPEWDKDDPHAHYISYFKHDRSMVRAANFPTSCLLGRCHHALPLLPLPLQEEICETPILPHPLLAECSRGLHTCMDATSTCLAYLARVQGHRCEANLKCHRISTSYLRYCQIVFLIFITTAAVGFTSSISWCQSGIWITFVSILISFMMWTIKAPCYVPVWSPGYQCGPTTCWTATCLSTTL